MTGAECCQAVGRPAVSPGHAMDEREANIGTETQDVAAVFQAIQRRLRISPNPGWGISCRFLLLIKI